MNHYIAISFSDHYLGRQRLIMHQKMAEALSTLQPGSVELIENSDDLIIMGYAGSVFNLMRKGEGAFVLNFYNAVTDLKLHRQLSGTDLAKAWFSSEESMLQDLAAPFCLSGRRRAGEAFSTVTDQYGLAHVYSFQGEGVCATSSSALLLGRIFQLEIDFNAVGEFANLGHYLGSATAVVGVRKSLPGRSLDMYSGRLSSRPINIPGPVEKFDSVNWLQIGENTLRESVMAYVDAYPECNIELSGGIDSRLLLAGMPMSQRRRHTAITLGARDSSDVRIAGQIAGLNGMRHKVIDIAHADSNHPDYLLEQLHQASLRHDHAVNPVDKLAIELVRSEIGFEPRLSGQNGEIARGFYYPGQPLDRSFEQRDFNRLVQWRLTGNDSACQDLFNEEFRDRAQKSLECSAYKLLQPIESWPLALDRFYLGQRMQRWCGTAVSATCAERPILMPFFNPGFVDWSLLSLPKEKYGSRLACSLICRLAPELASLPFDSGATPLQLTRSGISRKTSNALNLGCKGVKRIFNKVAGKRRHNLGTRSITESLESVDVTSKFDWNLMLSTGIFEEAFVDKIATGRLRSDRATLGFLIAIDYTMAYLRKPVNFGTVEIIERHNGI